MFVKQSTYNKALQEKIECRIAFELLKIKYENLIGKINAKGGEDFLDNGSLQPKINFNDEELKQMIKLYHPDKHNGKRLAVTITQKLNNLRC